MSKVICLFSGGMDSAVILHMAIEKFDEVCCITFNYDQRHIREIVTASELIVDAIKRYPNKTIEWSILDTKFIKALAPTSSLTNPNIATPDVNEMMGEAQPASYVANRNMMFLSIGASHAEAVKADAVWYGAAQVDSLAGYWDASIQFIESINGLLSLNRDHRIKVQAPLIDMSKSDIIKEGLRLRVPFDKTYTCYSGGLVSDATSASSSLRLQGFIQLGVRDPIEYIQQKEIDKKYDSVGCISINEYYNKHNEK